MSADELKPIGKPTDWDECYPGRFLKAGELKGINEEEARAKGRPADPQARVTLTIDSVDFYMLEGKKGKEKKCVIAFAPRQREKEDGEPGKLMSLNKINGLCLKAIFGRDPQQWVGKRVTVYPDIVREAGAMKGDPCVRIWGSPHLANDLDVSIALRKRSPYTMTMHRVGNAPTSSPSSPKTERQPGDD